MPRGRRASTVEDQSEKAPWTNGRYREAFKTKGEFLIGGAHSDLEVFRVVSVLRYLPLPDGAPFGSKERLITVHCGARRG